MENFIGVVQAFLANIGLISAENNPRHKITPAGMFRALMENPATIEIANLQRLKEGKDADIVVRYLQRSIESDTQDTDDCDVQPSVVWKESKVEKPFFTKKTIYIPDDEMAKYQNAATQPMIIGSEGARVMTGFYEVVLSQLNGIIQKINSNLLSSQTANWGVNTPYGSSAPQTINFSNTPTLDDGIVKLLLDYQANEGAGVPLVVGNGAVTAYDTLQALKVGVDSGGFGANQLNVYPDLGSISKWGANHFGLFMPGLVGFVDYNRNTGAFAGAKGSSIFFTMPVPVQLAGGAYSQLVFDCQLKYFDCPIKDEDGVVLAERGYALIVGKRYGLWNAPSDMFKAGDRLAGMNGSLHYVGATA